MGVDALRLVVFSLISGIVAGKPIEWCGKYGQFCHRKQLVTDSGTTVVVKAQIRDILANRRDKYAFGRFVADTGKCNCDMDGFNPSSQNLV